MTIQGPHLNFLVYFLYWFFFRHIYRGKQRIYLIIRFWKILVLHKISVTNALKKWLMLPYRVFLVKRCPTLSEKFIFQIFWIPLILSFILINEIFTKHSHLRTRHERCLIWIFLRDKRLLYPRHRIEMLISCRLNRIYITSKL